MESELLAHYSHNNEMSQTLKEHSMNVAKMMNEFLKTSNVEHICFIIGMLHDMGKACDKFQSHMFNNTDEKIDHATIGAKYLHEHEMKLNNMAVIQLIGMCIMSHHTGLENFLYYNGTGKYLTRINKNMDTYEEACQNYLKHVYSKEKIHEQIQLCEKESLQVINAIDKRYGPSNVTMKYFELGLFGRLLFSSLIDADRKDSKEFEEAIDNCDDENHSNIPWQKYYDNVMNYLEQIKSNTKVNQIRSEISDLCDEAGQRPQGIYELSVPTGGGKTIASLRFALRHAMTHPNIRHIYYVIPFNTILNQNSKTIKDILFPDGEATEQEFLLHNSTVVPSDEDTYQAFTERWNSNIIMTSSVHFLNALFNGRKQDARRMHQLSDSIIILDEIQSLPEKVIHMFNTAANFLHYTCHSTLLLCSATQPRLHDFMKPIQLSEHPSLIPNFETYYEKLKRVDIVSEYREHGYTISEFAQFALEKIRDYKSALIVMNTKAQASEVYQKLKEQISDNTAFFHLSTSMCVEHRQDQLKIIIDLLNRQAPVVLVSTNLIEAGIDISFPLGIRAMAGLESALQLAGRVNRNGLLIDENGKVYVLNIEQNEDKLEKLGFIGLKKESMSIFLKKFNLHPEAFGNDLGSLKSLKTYFDIYNGQLNNEMQTVLDYELEKGQKTIYDMLSVNKKGTDFYEDLKKEKFKLPLAFAYEEAGKQFCVIDQKTIDVIVPYGKGKEIIAYLLSGHKESGELKRLLREAQNYTVGLYPYQLDLLKDHITMIEGIEVRILDSSNYDEELGVVMDGECLGMFI